VNSQLCAPATLLHGKEFLVFIGGDFAVQVVNMAARLSADRAVVLHA